MSFVIRPARGGDIPAITAIYAHSVRHETASFELDAPSEEEMGHRRAALAEGGFPFLVAERDGTVLGYAYAGPHRSRPAYRWTVEDSIYIAPSAQRQGVGRALLGRLIEETEKLGFRLMVAVIGDNDSNASVELHRSLGFETAGTLQAIGYKHGKWLATVLMQRRIGEGSDTPPTITDR